MAHTLSTDFELIPDNTPVQLLWNLLEFYDEPIKLLLYKYGTDIVKKYFYYDYYYYISENISIV
jgi:hypothetical protein